MTSLSNTKTKRARRISFAPLCCILLLPLMLFLGDGLKEGVSSGLSLSLSTIIPTLFPFFIISDLWSCVMTCKEDGALGKLFNKFFGLPATLLPAFVLGTVCGFPLGVNAAVVHYKSGNLSKKELEGFCGFGNNPSLAFVISGIGAGLWSDVRLGVTLYISVVLSAITVGILFRRKQIDTNKTNVISRQNFSLVDSIKKAGLSSMAVSSYIIFFSALIGVLKNLIKNPLLLTVLSSILEITNASSLAASLGDKFALSGQIITAFSLGFSGLSVHLQTLSILPKEISTKRYFLMKLSQGILCSLFTFLSLLIK